MIVCLGCGAEQPRMVQCACGNLDFADYDKFGAECEMQWAIEPKVQRTMTARERQQAIRFGNKAHLVVPNVTRCWDGTIEIKWKFWG